MVGHIKVLFLSLFKTTSKAPLRAESQNVGQKTKKQTWIEGDSERWRTRHKVESDREPQPTGIWTDTL